MELEGYVVRGVESRSDGLLGHGVDVLGGALSFRGVLVERVREAAFAIAVGRASVEDSLVRDVRPTTRGLGLGVWAFSNAQVDLRRFAIENVQGSAVSALPFQSLARTSVGGADWFVRDVRSGTVRVVEDEMTSTPEGRPVAYGLHAGPGCSIDAARVVIDGGGFGFYNANGVVRVHTGVITNQLDAAGAIDVATPASAWSLDDVARAGSANDGVVQRNDLPTASSIPAPSASGR